MNEPEEGGYGSTFVTLTYKEEPNYGSLNLTDFQKFMKRFRKKVAPKKIRYYMCGEYGVDQDDKELLGRPHYHALIFNHAFPDKYFWKNSPAGEAVYRSPELESLWELGHSAIGDVNFQSAAYVARYVMKKINGEFAVDHYQKPNKYTGELFQVRPEFTTMSRRPGIGHSWYEKFADDLFPDDFAILNGKKMKVPEYYLQQLKIELPHLHQDLKTERTRKFALRADDNTAERLLTKEVCAQARLQHLERKL